MEVLPDRLTCKISLFFVSFDETGHSIGYSSQFVSWCTQFLRITDDMVQFLSRWYDTATVSFAAQTHQQSNHYVIFSGDVSHVTSLTVLKRFWTVKFAIDWNSLIDEESNNQGSFITYRCLEQSIVNQINLLKRETQQMIETAFFALMEIAQIGYCNSVTYSTGWNLLCLKFQMFSTYH